MATIYSHYDDEQLYSLFRAENWHSPQMSDLQRQQALQELSDRDAAANGTRAYPVEVTADTLPYGAYQPANNVISFNDGFVDRGMNEAGGPGEPAHRIPASNLHAMSTVYHENEHVYQFEFVNRQARAGEDLQLQRDLTANLHGFNYIQSGSDYDLYRIQIAEKDANEVGYAKTMASMRSTEQSHGGSADPNMEFYRGSIDRSYRDSLERARIAYNDPNVEKTLQRAMNDVAFQDRAISADMTDSYYDIRSIIALQEIDAYQEYLKEHPQLPEEIKRDCTQLIDARTQELVDLHQANAQAQLHAAQADRSGVDPASAGAHDGRSLSGDRSADLAGRSVGTGTAASSAHKASGVSSSGSGPSHSSHSSSDPGGSGKSDGNGMGM